MARSSQTQRRVACVGVADRLSDETASEVYRVLTLHSPVVEPGPVAAEMSLFYLDARQLRDEAAWARALLAEVRGVAGAPVCLGVAGSRFAAWVAAQTAPEEEGYQVVAVSDREFLAPLPTHWLPLHKEVQRRLRLLGLRTVGRFAALRPVQVVEQFGPECEAVHRWARGQDDRPLIGRRQEIVEAGHDFEVAEGRQEALLETAMRLAARALQDLPPPREAWAIRRVELETVREDRVLRQSAWLGSLPVRETLRAPLESLIQALEGEGPGVAEMRVRLLGFEPMAGKQLSLFGPSEARLRWERALKELAKKHSTACVAQVEVLDAGASLVAERYALKEYPL